MLYRFRIALSDVDRSVYESLDFRVPMHPSETEIFLLTRVLAFALLYEDGLEFSPGLGSPDEPAISLKEPDGRFRTWIEIGNPAARRLHKAAKAAGSVHVFTHKDPENLKREVAGETVHRVDEISVVALDPAFLKSLAACLSRDNRWDLLHQEGEITLNAADQVLRSTPTHHRLKK